MADTIIAITWKLGSKPVLGRRVQARPWRNRTLEPQLRRQTWKYGFKISPEIFRDKHHQAIVCRPCKRESTLVVHGRVDVEDVFRVFLDQRLHERLIQNECQIKTSRNCVYDNLWTNETKDTTNEMHRFCSFQLQSCHSSIPAPLS